LKQKDDDTIEEMENNGPQMKVAWYLPHQSKDEAFVYKPK